MFVVLVFRCAVCSMQYEYMFFFVFFFVYFVDDDDEDDDDDLVRTLK